MYNVFMDLNMDFNEVWHVILRTTNHRKFRTPASVLNNIISTAYGMGVNAQKTQPMTINIRDITRNIELNDQKLESVNSFIYCAFSEDEGAKA